MTTKKGQSQISDFSKITDEEGNKKNISDKEKRILNLEKKYMSTFEEILSSDLFQSQLIKMEDYVQRKKIDWGKSNKIEVAVERVMRFTIYKTFLEKDKIKGIYPSPISGDLGLILEDCIISLDTKTLDDKKNERDLDYFQLNHNQSSFNNYSTPGQFNTQMLDFDEGLPILSYIIQIYYTTDDPKGIRLFDDNSNEVINLACIPNGLLSDFFCGNLFYNAKTYKPMPPTTMTKSGLKRYKLLSYKEREKLKKDKQQVIHGTIIDKTEFVDLLDPLLKKVNFQYAYSVEENKSSEGKWFIDADIKNKKVRYKITARKVRQQAKSRTGLKKEEIWLEPQQDTNEGGGSFRVAFDSIRERFDSDKENWKGYLKIKLFRK